MQSMHLGLTLALPELFRQTYAQEVEADSETGATRPSVETEFLAGASVALSLRRSLALAIMLMNLFAETSSEVRSSDDWDEDEAKCKKMTFYLLMSSSALVLNFICISLIELSSESVVVEI
jgi:hypothetical protein